MSAQRGEADSQSSLKLGLLLTQTGHHVGDTHCALKLEADGSIGLLGPAGTPRDIAEHIAVSTRKIVTEPAFREMLKQAGIEPSSATTPEKFRESLAGDLALWSPVVKKLGLRVDQRWAHSDTVSR